jgi:hypothetical protein
MTRQRKPVRGRPRTPLPEGFTPLLRVSHTAAFYGVAFSVARRWHVAVKQPPSRARYGVPKGIRAGTKVARIMEEHGVCQKTAHKWLAIVSQIKTPHLKNNQT